MIFVIDNTEIVDELFPKKRINNSWISWKENPINDCTKAVDFFISSRKKGFLYWTVNLNSSTRIEWRNRIVTYTRFTRLKFYISYYCSNIFLSRLLNFKLSISNPISLSNHCFKKKTKLLFYTFKLCHISTNFNNLLISSSFSLWTAKISSDITFPPLFSGSASFLLVQDFQSKYLQGVFRRAVSKVYDRFFVGPPSLRHGPLNGKKLEKGASFCR